VTTQLRLVEPPEPRTRPTRGKVATAPARARTTRARTGRPDTRKAVSWGDWRLDAGTRRVGRAGVAEARRALEAALESELSQAS
jgi:hypothetical protein